MKIKSSILIKNEGVNDFEKAAIKKPPAKVIFNFIVCVLSLLLILFLIVFTVGFAINLAFNLI